MPHDETLFDLDSDEIEFSPEDDLPAGFSSFHQRFPAIVSLEFFEAAEPPPANDTPADGGDLSRRIDEYLEQLMRSRR